MMFTEYLTHHIIESNNTKTSSLSVGLCGRKQWISLAEGPLLLYPHGNVRRSNQQYWLWCWRNWGGGRRQYGKELWEQCSIAIWDGKSAIDSDNKLCEFLINIRNKKLQLQIRNYNYNLKSELQL